MAMYRPVLTDWMATTLRPTGIKLNRAARGKRREEQRGDEQREGKDGRAAGWLAGWLVEVGARMQSGEWGGVCRSVLDGERHTTGW